MVTSWLHDISHDLISKHFATTSRQGLGSILGWGFELWSGLWLGSGWSERVSWGKSCLPLWERLWAFLLDFIPILLMHMYIICSVMYIIVYTATIYTCLYVMYCGYLSITVNVIVYITQGPGWHGSRWFSLPRRVRCGNALCFSCRVLCWTPFKRPPTTEGLSSVPCQQSQQSSLISQ